MPYALFQHGLAISKFTCRSLAVNADESHDLVSQVTTET